jgi:tol-pal system protein YbgF
MIILRSLQISCVALCAFSTLVLPAQAQQRVQVGSIIERLDRLETEVTRLRVAPSGGSDLARLDQIEQELRRLTGIIERLEYDNRQANSALEKRLDGFADRLSAVESNGSPSASQPSVNTESSFARAAPPSPQETQGAQGGQVNAGLAPGGTNPLLNFQPQATFQPQPQQDPFQAQQPSQPFAGQQPSQQGLQSATALYDDGIRLLNVGSFDQAGARFEDLIAAYPEDQKAGEAQFWLGDMHFKLGRYEQAASAFLDSFRNWPEGAKAPDSLLKLGMTLANIGKTEEACLSFKQVAARYPGASPSLLRRADIESQRYRCG